MLRKDLNFKQVARNLGVHLTLEDVVDGIEDELLVIDSLYQLRFANAAVLSRLQETDRPGRLCYEILHHRDKPCSMPLWDCPLREVIRTGRIFTAIRPDSSRGSEAYVKISAYPLRDERGNIKAVVELRRNVTAERELETQVLKRHHQLLALNHISKAVSGLNDLDTVLKIALDNVLEIINGTVGGILLLDEENAVLHYRVQRGLYAKHDDSAPIAVDSSISGKVARTGEAVLVEDISKEPGAAKLDLINVDGIKGFVSIPLKAKDKVVGVMNVASHVAGRFGGDDVSLLNSIGDYLGTTIEQARLYERLERVGERYRALLRHALTAQENERKRIARELHDDTSQALTSLTLSLKALIGMAEMKGIKDEEFLGRLKTTHTNAVNAGNEIVRLMKELRPTLLDELGLSAAINRYAKDTLQAHGINVTFEAIGTDRRFPPEIEVTLFRVAQGVMGNILEHSGAKHASVKLSCDDTRCTLRIKDDGRGFDVSLITQVDPSGRGAGLFTMKERIRLVGGACHIDSQPGRGTDIMVKVPLVEGVVVEEDKSTDS